MMKEKLQMFLLTIIFIGIGYLWYYTYTYIKTIEMVYNDGVTEITYTIAPKFTKLIVRDNGDSSYVFYNDNRKSLIIIKMEKLKYVKFIEE